MCPKDRKLGQRPSPGFTLSLILGVSGAGGFSPASPSVTPVALSAHAFIMDKAQRLPSGLIQHVK